MTTKEIIEKVKEHTDCNTCQEYTDLLGKVEHRGTVRTEPTTELIIRSLYLHVIYKHSPTS